MKAKASKSKKDRPGQPGSPSLVAGPSAPRGSLRPPKWLVVVIGIALVGGASFAAFEFLLPDRIPPELVGEWRVVGGGSDSLTITNEAQRGGKLPTCPHITERLF